MVTAHAKRRVSLPILRRRQMPQKQTLTTLDKLPEGTVSEVYVSYDRAYTPKDVYSFAKNTI